MFIDMSIFIDLFDEGTVLLDFVPLCVGGGKTHFMTIIIMKASMDTKYLFSYAPVVHLSSFFKIWIIHTFQCLFIILFVVADTDCLF